MYATERRSERENLKGWEKVGNRMLLWHGTRGENIVGILQTGFRIAPSDARRTGAMFGEGVYFSDTFNKSFQYANTNNYHRHNRDLPNQKLAKRYVFLCEVALGNVRRLLNAQNVEGLPNEQYHSVMGYGRMGPNPKGNIYLSNGCTIPLGRYENNPPITVDGQPQHWGLQNNEYVVYNTSQIRIRYVVELRQLESYDY